MKFSSLKFTPHQLIPGVLHAEYGPFSILQAEDEASKIYLGGCRFETYDGEIQRFNTEGELEEFLSEGA